MEYNNAFKAIEQCLIEDIPRKRPRQPFVILPPGWPGIVHKK